MLPFISLLLLSLSVLGLTFRLISFSFFLGVGVVFLKGGRPREGMLTPTLETATRPSRILRRKANPKSNGEGQPNPKQEAETMSTSTQRKQGESHGQARKNEPEKRKGNFKTKKEKQTPTREGGNSDFCQPMPTRAKASLPNRPVCGFRILSMECAMLLELLMSLWLTLQKVYSKFITLSRQRDSGKNAK